MKSGILIFVGLILSTSIFSAQAQAGDLLADACVDGAAVVQRAAYAGLIVPAAFSSDDVYAMNLSRSSCQEMKSAKEAIEMAGLVLWPARTAIKMAGVGSAIDASIEALGLSNPAVLGVTVIGATGVVVVYLILRQTVAECEHQDRDDFKQQIFEELESKYGIHAMPSQQIQFNSK